MQQGVIIDDINSFNATIEKVKLTTFQKVFWQQEIWSFKSTIEIEGIIGIEGFIEGCSKDLFPATIDLGERRVAKCYELINSWGNQFEKSDSLKSLCGTICVSMDIVIDQGRLLRRNDFS